MKEKELGQPHEPSEISLEEKLSIVEGASLDASKKLDLALLLLERKSGAQLGKFKVIEGEPEKVRKETIESFSVEFETIKVILDNLQLEYHILDSPEERDGIFGFSILVAKNKEVLSQFVNASINKDDKEFGLIVGYPKTAVESYNTKEAFDYTSELPEEELKQLQEEGLIPFLHFKPSRTHWKKELEIVRENARILREKAPVLFDEIIQQKEEE